jgi:hypothetical protein
MAEILLGLDGVRRRATSEYVEVVKGRRDVCVLAEGGRRNLHSAAATN